MLCVFFLEVKNCFFFLGILILRVHTLSEYSSAIRYCSDRPRQILLYSTKRRLYISQTHVYTHTPIYTLEHAHSNSGEYNANDFVAKPIPLYHYHRLLILLSLPFSSYTAVSPITFLCSYSRSFILLLLYLNASASAGVCVHLYTYIICFRIHLWLHEIIEIPFIGDYSK